MEMIQNILGHPMVFVTMDFIKVETCFLEERSGFKCNCLLNVISKNNKAKKNEDCIVVQDDISSELIIAAMLRTRKEYNLPEWRQYNGSELRIIKDLLYSNVTIDKVTRFSIRPPEIKVWCKSIEQYYRWFHISESPLKFEELQKCFTVNLTKSKWIDGLGFQIKIYDAVLDEIGIYMKQNKNEKIEYSQLFELLHEICVLKNLTLFEEFVITEDKIHKAPIVVFSNIRPNTGPKFLWHIILTVGSIENEFDISMSGTYRKMFEKAGFISENENPEKCAIELTRRYVLEQLKYLPISSQRFDYYLVCAYNLIPLCMCHNEICIQDTPSCLYTTIQETHEKKESRENKKQSRHVESNIPRIGYSQRDR